MDQELAFLHHDAHIMPAPPGAPLPIAAGRAIAGAMVVESFPVGPLGCNCSIVFDEAAKKAIVIDPGGNFDTIRARLEAKGLAVTAIVHTHTHIDHVGATAPLQRLTGATASIHEADRFLYDMLAIQASLVGCAVPEKTDMDGSLVDGLALRAGDVEMGVLHTPGHTPGSVTFVVRDERPATRVFRRRHALPARHRAERISGAATRRSSPAR